MNPEQLAKRVATMMARHGAKDAIARTMRSLTDAEVLDLWRSHVGQSVIRQVWRRHRPTVGIATSLKAVLETLVPIGVSGTYVPIGKMGAKEVRAIAQFRERAGRTMLDHAKVLNRVAAQLGQRTIAEAWQDISGSDRRDILRAFGVSAVEAVA